MAFVERLEFRHEHNRGAVYGPRGIGGFTRDRESCTVRIDIACTYEEATIIAQRVRAGMGFDVERGGVDDGPGRERALGDGAPALPPGPIEAELLDDEEPRRRR
jgi:hypothetical protein